MATLIDVDPGRPASRQPRTVDVLGAQWPVHKAHAVAAAVVVALVSLVLLGSLAVTAWASGLTLLAVWWGERYLPGTAAVAPASNPPGIS
ncbi:hypothetical protein GR168_14375 [Gordonia sp. JH63]|uniref:hypothetical protein n=1 Tax=Gordonia TaxID=2053 RepID=UPI0006E22101|nr:MULTISPECIES: hypothetical protein [unclassified Gordonia (in: high G+C Gram-positive bacteria)]MCZ4535006.1 hypothetical protein [Gordonia terrae]MBN0971626.1 hypothetical protein [Gordonia sp. BP-119]MBN0981240.1 hypothetical protein [Gordonia sp. BP-94]MBR7192751.1 hypothetical protein [Gordonia sp. SCSIO 19800]MCT1352741.1 hypothetical protein [Gordonia sp. p3-SID1431]